MTDHYEGVQSDQSEGEIDCVRCTWCGNFAPLGVPIAHTEDCGPKIGEKVTTPKGPGKVEQILLPTDVTYWPEKPDGLPRYGVRWRPHTWEWFHPNEITRSE